MTARIRSAAVLGAGTMGAQIAAHLANAGVRTDREDGRRHESRYGDHSRQARPHRRTSSRHARNMVG